MKYFEKYALNQHIFRAWIQPSAAKKPQSKYISYLDFSFLLAVNKNLKQNQLQYNCLHRISISTSQSKIYKKLTKKRKDEVMLFD